MYNFILIILISVLFFGCATDSSIKSGSVARVLSISQATNPEDILDPMDSEVGWRHYAEKGANITLTTADGKYGQSLRLSYEMMKGKWAAITKTLNSDFSTVKRLRFWVKGEGSANSMEIRLEDSKKTNFGYLLRFKSNIGAWMAVDIPVSKFEYWWGDKNSLDFEKIMNIHFVVSKKDGDKGGSGAVYLDQMEIDR